MCIDGIKCLKRLVGVIWKLSDQVYLRRNSVNRDSTWHMLPCVMFNGVLSNYRVSMRNSARRISNSARLIPFTEETHDPKRFYFEIFLVHSCDLSHSIS